MVERHPMWKSYRLRKPLPAHRRIIKRRLPPRAKGPTSAPMRERLSKLDHRLAVTGLVLVASTALLLVGLVSILVTLSDDNVELPNEGSLEEILQERESSSSPGRQGSQPEGPAPARIAIPSIGVDAAVQAQGRDSPNQPAVPDSGSDVAWYTFTAPPGGGSNAVFSGHVDWYYWGEPGEGIFYHPRGLQMGGRITGE